MKIRQGNDYSLSWTIYRINSEVAITEGVIPEGAIVEDLTTAQNLSITIIHASYPSIRYSIPPVIVNNAVKFDITPSHQLKLGKYYSIVDFDKDDAALQDRLRHFRIDAYAFEIVDKTADAISSDNLVINSLIVGGINGVNGLSAYQIAQKYGYAGTEQQFVEWMRQPAIDAAAYVDAAITNLGVIETAVSENEIKRQQNEIDREQNDATITENENTRKDAEVTRGLNEDERKLSENTRKLNEGGRQDEESIRKNKEDERQQAEIQRGIKENTRNDNENERVLGENAREEGFNILKTGSEEAILLSNTATSAANKASADAILAKEAAEVATSAAITAKQNAETATVNANKAAEDAITAASDVNVSKESAIAAAVAATLAKQNAETATAAAITAKDNAETATANANKATTDANAAILAASTAINLANNAANNATTAAASVNLAIQYAESAIESANAATGFANTATAAANAAANAATTAASAANTAANNLNGLGGTYNVTVAIPLLAGSYYTSITARAAVPVGNRLLGRVITYATASGVWYTEKFIGSTISNWTTDANWERVPDNSQLVQLGADLNKIPDNLEPALAEILNQQNKRIEALENLIKNMLFKSGQFDTLEVVKEFNIYGKANLYVIKDTAPSVVPDFWGQVYINTSGAGTIYQAKGISSTSDWKQTSN